MAGRGDGPACIDENIYIVRLIILILKNEFTKIPAHVHRFYSWSDSFTPTSSLRASPLASTAYSLSSQPNIRYSIYKTPLLIKDCGPTCACHILSWHTTLNIAAMSTNKQ